MNIAMIGSRGVGSGYGGVESVLDNLCPYLESYGHNIDIYSREDVDYQDTNRIRAIRVKSLHSKHFETITRSIVSFYKAVNRYDIIHFHSIGSGILTPFSKFVGQKSVITIHGLDSERAKWGFVARHSLRLAEKTLVHNTDAITVVSNQLRKYFIEKHDCVTTYIPNGVKERHYIEPSDYLENIGLYKKKYVLFSSRLTPEKGAHDLITAFNRLNTSLKLVIAGSSGSEDYYEYLKTISDQEKIVFTGHVRGQNLWELYSNAYLFVLPSYLEGMSMALLEAMSFKIAPLVSNIPENLDVIGNNGFSFEKMNISDLESKLKYLIENETEVHRIEENLNMAANSDWQSIACDYDKIYRRVLEKNTI